MMHYIKGFLFSQNPKKRFALYIQLLQDFGKRSAILRKFIVRKLYYLYHCDISHHAEIHPSTTFVHPLGVVIGSNVVIEKDCFIYQGVTLGSNFGTDNTMPYIKEGTKIGAGAKIIGGITIGTDCIIGANAVVTRSVPDHSIVYGTNIIRHKDNKCTTK